MRECTVYDGRLWTWPLKETSRELGHHLRELGFYYQRNPYAVKQDKLSQAIHRGLTKWGFPLEDQTGGYELLHPLIVYQEFENGRPVDRQLGMIDGTKGELIIFDYEGLPSVIRSNVERFLDEHGLERPVSR